ncbi:MAG TPA: alkaline phosphatase D family protein [Chitinophagales bacterium]|nr:alkaline phosphatase D family protein [Chitinophagales bacterium]
MKGTGFCCITLAIFFSARVFAQQSFPPNIYPDTLYAPFYYGVASGDPLQNGVIIWTKVFTQPGYTNAVTLSWQVAADSNFTSIVNSGNAQCTPEHDFTTKADVRGLQPGQHYYYRFKTAEGKTSQTGMAETLPPDTATHFKLAIVSCSSVWSGYFNAYRRIAERDDIDFVVHLGDYVYDFVDEQEKVRVPGPYPTVPQTLAEWRERHTYYLLDPDLRAARQNKTWIAEWDNHDSRRLGPDGKVTDAIRAFEEYLPVREPDTTQPARIYRTLHFGKLADITMIDMYLYRGLEEYAPGKKTVLGNVQDEWFKNELLQSKAEWHLIGNQEMMGSWLSEGLPKGFHLPGNGKFFDPDDWDGYVDDRNRLYHFIDSNHINNFLAMSGDLHMSFVDDLTPDPKNKKLYNRRTGKGAVGVEVLGPSISRGNMDERGIPKFVIPLVQRISLDVNPHHRWCQFWKHGYVTLNVNPEKCIAEFWYSKILHPTGKETFGRGFVVKNGANHWERKANRLKRRSTHPG